jgi:glycosyltransferase involved in cell wall biosynthesis
MEAHAHRGMRLELRRLTDILKPDIVQIEHVELGLLVDTIPSGAKSVLMAHDVLLGLGHTHQVAQADHIESALYDKFDLTVCCSDEDAWLIGRNCLVVPNGIDRAPLDYRPSQLPPKLAFVGPFRVNGNLSGLRWFLRRIYPSLRQSCNGLMFSIVGGKGAENIARKYPEFGQAGIDLKESVQHIQSFIGKYTLTVNPTMFLRGSSIKVMESLACGRVCVVTPGAARGFDKQAPPPGLILADHAGDWIEKIGQLIHDNRLRHELEEKQLNVNNAVLTWEQSAHILRRAYESLLA